jgi:hypothetical protein
MAESKRQENVENSLFENIMRCDKVCKYVYKIIMEKKMVEHHKIEKWSEKIGVDVTEEWFESLKSLRKATVCSKLRSFQFMIVHRALVTNEFLYKCNIKYSDKCYFCGEYSESIEHLFCDCIIIKRLWYEFSEKLLPHMDLQRYIEKQYIIFGINNEEHNKLINHLFILVKRYIYVTRCKGKDLSVHGLFLFIKQYYNMETSKEYTSTICNKWTQIKHVFT